jgi:hypothetical protein
LAELGTEINAGVVVVHNIYFEDEWAEFAKKFEKVKTKVCVENIASTIEPLKFMMRYDYGRCLDLEHMQIEICGFFEEEFVNVMKEATHVHMTGYVFGSNLWHTHIHYSPKENMRALKLLKQAGYKGMVVSEAKSSCQTLREFVNLKKYYDEFLSNEGVIK